MNEETETTIEKKSYYAIIPAEVRYDERLKPNAKLLYGEITALCNEKGYCWASNYYFAKLYGVKNETISRWISQLAKFKYIVIDVVQEEGNQRRIRINEHQLAKGLLIKKSRGHVKKVKHNNKDNIERPKYHHRKKNGELSDYQLEQVAEAARIEKEIKGLA